VRVLVERVGGWWLGRAHFFFFFFLSLSSCVRFVAFFWAFEAQRGATALLRCKFFFFSLFWGMRQMGWSQKRKHLSSKTKGPHGNNNSSLPLSPSLQMQNNTPRFSLSLSNRKSQRKKSRDKGEWFYLCASVRGNGRRFERGDGTGEFFFFWSFSFTCARFLVKYRGGNKKKVRTPRFLLAAAAGHRLAVACGCVFFFKGEGDGLGW
jgi:hypothetical protein